MKTAKTGLVLFALFLFFCGLFSGFHNVFFPVTDVAAAGGRAMQPRQPPDFGPFLRGADIAPITAVGVTAAPKITPPENQLPVFFVHSLQGALFGSFPSSAFRNALSRFSLPGAGGLILSSAAVVEKERSNLVGIISWSLVGVGLLIVALVLYSSTKWSPLGRRLKRAKRIRQPRYRHHHFQRQKKHLLDDKYYKRNHPPKNPKKFKK